MSKRQSPTGGDAITSSLYAGSAAAVLGAGLVAGHATLKGRPVWLWGGVAAGQCFVLGSTFWFSRSMIHSFLVQGSSISTGRNNRDDLISSGIAGSVAGMAGGALRGRKNILPGAIMLSLLGVTGQIAYTGMIKFVDSSRKRRPILDVLSDSSWWPLKSISDNDYERELTEKVIAIEAEIAMIDEKLMELKQTSSQIAIKS